MPIWARCPRLHGDGGIFYYLFNNGGPSWFVSERKISEIVALFSVIITFLIHDCYAAP